MKTEERPATTLRRVFLRRSVPYGLFAVAFGLSIAASWYLSSTAAATAEAQAHSEFLTDAQQTRRQIQAGLNSYLEVVRAGAVLLSADNEINGAEFRRFVEGLQLPERYPGMEGIGFAPCVRRRDLERFLRLIDLDGNKVRLWPATVRPDHCPTVFLEPTNGRNKHVIGFDLASESALQEAMAKARDTGQPAASRKLTALPIADHRRHGNMVLFIPVYRLATPLRTVDARQRALVGFVFSPLNSERLLEDIVQSTMPSVGFAVYDGPVATPVDLIGQSNAPTVAARYESSEVVQVTNREWLVAVKSRQDPITIVPPAARQALIGGIMLSFMLFLVTRAQVHAWEVAARHEAELRASAQALRESEAQAHAANRAKDEFLATLSHELRTPLNVVLGWVSMLRLGTVPAERLAHAIEIVERNARQQAELIDDLLDVSRIVTGQLHLKHRPLTLAHVVSAIVESLRPSAEAKGVVLSVASLSEASTIMGDADRLRQAVWNLISNAIKFTLAGGCVWVELTRVGQHVRLTVGDTGIGISSAFLPHVFERFRQADSSTTRTHGGVGLGLAIARHLVELHGGTIEARSDGPGHGATFVVVLPAVPVTAASSSPAHRASRPPPAPPQLNGVRVLVVDDDPNTLELLTEALGTSGALVTSADSARRALERLGEDGADVIVSDIAMPGEDGVWLMQRVRRLSGDRGCIPAIALTALARGEDRARVIKAGYQMHLTKPVQLDELQMGVATLVAEGPIVAARTPSPAPGS